MNDTPEYPFDPTEEAFERLREMAEERRKQRMTEAREWPPPEATVKEWEIEGLKCAIARGQALCGYVHVPADHPDAKLDYDDVGVEVHGGLTFRCKTAGGGAWFGFDCAHHSDWFGFSEPVVSEEGVDTVGFEHPGHIWTVEEVVEETERLAMQFAARAKVNNNE